MDDEGTAPFCYLTTTGRVSGRPHTIEIWFALRDRTLYLLSGGRDRSDWVRNLLAHPEVTVRIGRRDAPTLAARARVARVRGRPRPPPGHRQVPARLRRRPVRLAPLVASGGGRPGPRGLTG
jgi:deazaflavin-dependent oxidoreductase (nitroreductase family)